MSNSVLEQISFEDVMLQVRTRDIPWVNTTCKVASITARRYFWGGKYGELGKIIASQNERELMFECLYISRNKRLKEIEAMGYEVTQECVCLGTYDRFSKVYYIAKKRG